MKLRFLVSILCNLILIGICAVLLSSRQSPFLKKTVELKGATSAGGEQMMLSDRDLVSRPDLSELDYEEQLTALIAEGWSVEDARTYALGRILHRMEELSLEDEEEVVDWEKRREEGVLTLQLEEILGELNDRPGFSFNYPTVPLSEAKRKALARMELDYNLLEEKLYYESDRMLSSEERERLGLLKKARRKDIEALLTPEEFFEYEVRISKRAQGLRSQLDIFEPTEEEFREIFRIKQEEDRARESLTKIEEHKLGMHIREIKEVAEQKLEELLGERYVPYVRSRNSDYRNLVAVAERLDLPRERVDDVFDLEDVMRSKRATVKQDPELAPEAREKEIRELNDELHEGVAELMGERGYEVFLENGGRRWLDGGFASPDLSNFYSK